MGKAAGWPILNTACLLSSDNHGIGFVLFFVFFPGLTLYKEKLYLVRSLGRLAWPLVKVVQDNWGVRGNLGENQRKGGVTLVWDHYFIRVEGPFASVHVCVPHGARCLERPEGHQIP